jgi:threonine dehydrogenase-like Zn-dependent dehydrogenase
VYKIPEHLSLEEVSILDCVAVGVHAIQRYTPKLTDTCAVIGDAAIGLSTVACAKAQGAAQVAVIGHHETNLERAKLAGADVALSSADTSAMASLMKSTDGLGVDVVYETVGGASTSLTEAGQIVRPGGTIVIIGCFTRTPELEMMRLMRREINLLFSWSYAKWDGIPEFQIALDLLASGRVNTRPFLTHEYPLQQVADAFQCAMNKRETGALKVLVIGER